MAQPLKTQLAEARAEAARLRKLLTTKAPGRTHTGTPAWEILNQITDWLRWLHDIDWPLPGRGPAEGTIGRTGHTDPTGTATINRLSPDQERRRRWTPGGEAERLLTQLLRELHRSQERTTGPDHTRRTPATPTHDRPRCPAHCNHPHAQTWTHCPWTGTPLEHHPQPNTT